MSFRLTNPKISIITGLDLSSATSAEIHFKKPDGNKGKWIGTISEKKIEYQTAGSDLDQEGRWTLQAVATFGQLLQKGEFAKIVVQEPIKE